MSWQSYVDDHLMLEVSPGHALECAAIVGQDGNVWAQSAGFPDFLADQVDKIVKGFTDTGPLAQEGLHIGAVKYMVIQGDPGQVIRGKKGTSGVTIKKTNSALVIGVYKEPTTPSECNIVVEKLGDYLYDQGI